MIAAHRDEVMCVAAAADGRVITGSMDRSIKVWRSCRTEVERRPGNARFAIPSAHRASVKAVTVLPGGARFVSVGEKLRG